jgi:hypothetical protein
MALGIEEAKSALTKAKDEYAVMFHKCLTPKSVTIRSYKQQK